MRGAAGAEHAALDLAAEAEAVLARAGPETLPPVPWRDYRLLGVDPADFAPAQAEVSGKTTHTDGAAVLARVEAFINTYVVLPEPARLPVALWAVATHVFQAFDVFPYLAVISPTKRVGKTRLLRLLKMVCLSPTHGVFPSPATLYRMLKEKQGNLTLLLDECEFLFRPNSEIAQVLVAVLNAGFESGAVVPRCTGPKGEQLEYFPVYCPKALAAIGRLPETITDRSIVISMQRRIASEKMARFVGSRVKRRVAGLSSGVAKLASEAKASIAEAYEGISDLGFLADREADCWLPLFAVCAVIAPGRLAELQRCAISLSATKAEADADDSLPIRLLADVRRVWPEGEENVFTTELLERLRHLEESPWHSEVELSARKVARMLRPFGIEGRSVRVGDRAAKGYSRETFQPGFSRYLGFEKVTGSQPA